MHVMHLLSCMTACKGCCLTVRACILSIRCAMMAFPPHSRAPPPSTTHFLSAAMVVLGACAFMHPRRHQHCQWPNQKRQKLIVEILLSVLLQFDKSLTHTKRKYHSAGLEKPTGNQWSCSCRAACLKHVYILCTTCWIVSAL